MLMIAFFFSRTHQTWSVFCIVLLEYVDHAENPVTVISYSVIQEIVQPFTCRLTRI